MSWRNQLTRRLVVGTSLLVVLLSGCSSADQATTTGESERIDCYSKYLPEGVDREEWMDACSNVLAQMQQDPERYQLNPDTNRYEVRAPWSSDDGTSQQASVDIPEQCRMMPNRVAMSQCLGFVEKDPERLKMHDGTYYDCLTPPYPGHPAIPGWISACGSVPQEASQWRPDSSTSAQQSTDDYDQQTRYCVAEALQGRDTCMKPFYNGPDFDQFAVQQAEREYQRAYDEQTDYCVEEALAGRDNCTGIFYYGVAFDEWKVQEAQRTFQRNYEEETEYCAEEARQGRDTCTDVFYSGHPYDEWEVEQAEDEYDREYDAQTEYCADEARAGRDTCTDIFYTGPDYDEWEVEQAEDEYQRECESNSWYDDSSSYDSNPWDTDCQ